MESSRYSLVIPNILVAKVEERFKTEWLRGSGKDAEFMERSQGWWITLLGSRESLYAGELKPNLAKGDLVTIRIDKICVNLD